MIKRIIGALYGIFLEEPLDRLHNWQKRFEKEYLNYCRTGCKNCYKWNGYCRSQASEELNMAARAERLKISTTEENRAIKALQEAAYIKGYMTAELSERERRKRARERKKRKRYFLTQKLYGVALLILTAVSVKLLEGDITAAFILVPMGIVLITSKEMLIVNKYFWECEGKEWYL